MTSEWASAAYRGVCQRQVGQTPGRESQVSKDVQEELWWEMGLLGSFAWYCGLSEGMESGWEGILEKTVLFLEQRSP